jgi:hypothetical protein
MKNYIEVKSDLKVNASPGCKPIKHKAIAGLSEAQLLERHTIGEYDEEEGCEEKEGQKTKAD